MELTVPLIVGVLVLATTPAVAEQLIWLPDLPSGIIYTDIRELSDDGNVVVGRSSTGSVVDAEFERAFAWSSSSGMTRIPLSPATPNDCSIRAGTEVASGVATLSADGRVIRGFEQKWCSSGPPFTNTWVTDYFVGGTTARVPSDNVMEMAGPIGLSIDGQTMIGIGTTRTGASATVTWTFNDGYQVIDTGPYRFEPRIGAVDANAMLIGGKIAGGHPALLSRQTGVQKLTFNGQPLFGSVHGLSRNGEFVVVHATSSAGLPYKALLFAHGQWIELRAVCKNNDGTSEAPQDIVPMRVSEVGEVVGQIVCRLRRIPTLYYTQYRAAYWDRNNVFTDLSEKYFQSTTDPWLTDASDISADGSVVVGGARSPAVDTLGWYLDRR